MSVNNKQRSPNRFVILALFVLFLDQIIKFFAVSEIINIEFSKNSGILFGVQLDTNFVFVLFAIFLLIAIVSFKKIKIFESDIIAIMTFCLILGGVISNLTDRILYGHIIDYINLFNLFSFNIADLAICFGALILSWRVLGK